MEARTVALSEQALLDTRDAFDGVAQDYDRSNVENPILAGMRERSLSALRAWAAGGSHVLNLGCGPGTDEMTLVRAGYRVTAIDWSPEMVIEARRRVTGAAPDVEVRQLGIHQLDALAPTEFDAAYSGFGPLNCVPSLELAAQLIAARLRPGGVLVASVIGRFCPWDVMLHLARGRFARAAIRLHRGPVAVPLNGRTVWTTYWSPSAFVSRFVAAGFEAVSVRGLGVAVPPPYAEAWARRHPGIVSRLERIDDRIAGWPVVRQCGDHFLVVLRRG
jgi:SAM-dependent methyltransferase